MQDTPRGSRMHIALFGRRNVGKSSLINALTGQDLAIVSPLAGTTTDPVYKSMEILPIGPVVLIDTAGLDDDGALGHQRVEKSLAVLDKTDLALLVVNTQQGLGATEQAVLKAARQRNLPLIGVLNKADLQTDPPVDDQEADLASSIVYSTHQTTDLATPPLTCTEGTVKPNASSLPGILWVKVSALTGQGLSELKKAIIEHAPDDWAEPTIAGDLVSPGEIALLVTPIDKAAPRGRLILPQVQTIRDLLDNSCLTMVARETELQDALQQLSQPPALVITDSQVFKEVDAIIPTSVPLTSFSILFARYKGDLTTLVNGALAVERLRPGDQVLIAEACTHHRQDDDIGTVKIPRWLRQKVGGELQFNWCSGATLPPDLARYKLVVHCGACMINRREMLSRIIAARSAGVPVVNYGVLIAYMLGILPRTLAPFGGMPGATSGKGLDR